jgi:hypothetical protein
MKIFTILIFLSGCTALQTETLRAAYQDKEECEALAAEAPGGRQALEVKNDCLRERQAGRAQ